MYTVIPSANSSTPTCQNVTYPASALNVNAAVINGAFSQYGWPPQVRWSVAVCAPMMNMRFVWRVSVYGYPGPGKEWHAAVYANGKRRIFVSPLGCVTQNAQVAPTLHTPLNLTTNGANPINWTITLVCDSKHPPPDGISIPG